MPLRAWGGGPRVVLGHMLSSSCGLMGAAKPSLKCNIDFFLNPPPRLGLQGGVLHAGFLHSEFWKGFFI